MIFLAPYAYDRMPSGQPRKGVPPSRLGSKARCDILSVVEKKLIHDQHLSFMWILVAGYSKDSPSRATELVPTSLADDIASYLRNRYGLIVKNPLAWGTYMETKFIIEEIDRIATSLNITPEVYVSTNLGHLLRVRMCWFFLKPDGWQVYFVRAHHSFTPKEWVQETTKFFVYLYRFIFKKW